MSDASSSEEEEFRDESEKEDEEEEEEEPQSSDEDDDKPIASLKHDSNQRASPRRKATKEPVKYDQDDDDDDDDDEDDIPLAQLAKKKESKKPSAASNGSTASSKKKKAAEPPKKKKKAEPAPAKSSSSSSSSSSKKFEFASAALYGTECLKGLLIQRLLCRWWYAIDWPKANGTKTPADYEPLDGFPGVFVCTSAANAGHILDTRDMNNCPSFQKFAKKDSSELQKLLLTALQEQKRQLVQAEGAGTPTEKEIDSLIKWTNKLNPDKADKEAVKVLKANKITL